MKNHLKKKVLLIHEKNLVLYKWFDTYTHRDMETYAGGGKEKTTTTQEKCHSTTTNTQQTNDTNCFIFETHTSNLWRGTCNIWPVYYHVITMSCIAHGTVFKKSDLPGTFIKANLW